MRVSNVKILNPVRALRIFGQSVWLDHIDRDLITSGRLQHLIVEDGLGGVTSNPTIFERALIGNTHYAEDLSRLRHEFGLDAKGCYERLAVEDIQDAADLLQPVYARTERQDGYVSLEVSPHLARDTRGTLDEACRLLDAVGRENLMIKVPATPEGIPAIVQLISRGINVNVTLIFSQDIYARVAEAYLLGLEQLETRGDDVGGVASVASVFVSRIDTAADAAIEARLKTATTATKQDLLRSLQGKVAVANAKLIYQRYQTLFSGPRWDALAGRGAMPQRVLWASTGTKNPHYRDVMYLEELIGPETVSTVPPATLEAFRDHGHPEFRLTEGIEEAKLTLLDLQREGISLKELTDRLLEEGLQSFNEAFDRLLAAVAQHSNGDKPVRSNGCPFALPASSRDGSGLGMRR
jgi:transaldolase/glucose-6-phosphate isomerase